MIEDPREVERRRLLGIEDPDTPTREELAEALEKVSASFFIFSSEAKVLISGSRTEIVLYKPF